MNRALRRRHRTMMALLAPAAALVLVAGLALRHPPPLVPALPRLPQAVPPGGRIVAEEQVLGLSVRLLADSGTTPGRVELEPLAPVRAADPLAYWAPLPAGDGLPDGAVFLGALAPGRVVRARLPGMHGYLVIYSLATRTVLGSAPLPQSESGAAP